MVEREWMKKYDKNAKKKLYRETNTSLFENYNVIYSEQIEYEPDNNNININNIWMNWDRNK